MQAPKIILKRIYEPYCSTDGYRVLVDRLWPRGIKKVDARLDDWAKDLAPSTALRTNYNHQPERWEEFQQKYRDELADNEQISHYLDKWEDQARVTLLYASKDPSFTHAQVLKSILEEQYQSRG